MISWRVVQAVGFEVAFGRVKSETLRAAMRFLADS